MQTVQVRKNSKKVQVGMTKKTASKTWFPAKKHGFGWGLPNVWQGWVIFVGCMGLGLAPLLYISVFYRGDTYCAELIQNNIKVSCDPEQATWLYMLASVLWLIAMILLLVTICHKKGEKPTWRWTKKDKHAKKS